MFRYLYLELEEFQFTNRSQASRGVMSQQGVITPCDWLKSETLKHSFYSDSGRKLVDTRTCTSVADQLDNVISELVSSDCSSHRANQKDYHNYSGRDPAQSAFRQRASHYNIVNKLIMMRKLSISHRIYMIFFAGKLMLHDFWPICLD